MGDDPDAAGQRGSAGAGDGFHRARLARFGRSPGEPLRRRPPIDLRLRWAEWRYVFHNGQNPFDVYLAAEPEGPVRSPLTDAARSRESSSVDPALGEVIRAPYPPWAYVAGTPLWAWPWPAARRVAALAAMVSLAVLCAWSADLLKRPGAGRPRRSSLRAMLPAMLLMLGLVIGCAHHYTILRLGQVTLYVVALLALAELLLAPSQRDGGAKGADRLLEAAAGLMIGLAMLKPTIAAPFLLVLLVRRHWWGLASAAAFLLAGSFIVWRATGAAPWMMLSQMRVIAEQIEVGKEGAAGPIGWLIQLGWMPADAARLAAMIVLPLTVAALLILRNRSVSLLFAVAAVGAQLWTHHKPYDELVILLLAVPLLAVSVRGVVGTQPVVPWLRWMAAALVGLSLVHLGVPRLFGGSASTGWTLFQTASWLLGCAVLIRSDPASK